MATPSTSSEITKEWLEVVLSEYEGRQHQGTSVHVSSFQISPGAAPGDNFGGEVVRVQVDGRVERRVDGQGQGQGQGQGEGEGQEESSTLASPTPKTYQLFGKFLTQDPFVREMARAMQMVNREVVAYTTILPQLNRLQAERAGGNFQIHVPDHICGTFKGDNFVLMIEDLRPLGYVMMDKGAGLGLPHVLLAVEQLARLHAVSYAYCQSHAIKEQYPALNESPKLISTFFQAITCAVYDGVVAAAKRRAKEYGPLLATMKANKEAVVSRLAALMDSPPLTCLAHGDFWLNNVMYLHEEVEGEPARPQKVMLIDWAQMSVRSPVLDLQYFLHTSTQVALRRSHLQHILRHYHDTFTTATTHLGTPLASWGFEELMAEWQRTRLGGVFLGALTCMGTLSKAGQSFNKRKGGPPGSFRSRVEKQAARVVGKPMVYLLTSRVGGSVIRASMKSSFQPIMTELASWTNSVLNTRVFDLMTEAHGDGLFEAK